jgi:predicted transcriptional regulator
MSKQFVKLFNEKRGVVRKQRDAIITVLLNGPATISEVEPKVRLPKTVILWNLMALIRWGDVSMIAERDGEFVYSLNEA